MTAPRGAHAMPFGAAPDPGGRTRFRLWAPAAREVAVEIDGATTAMRALADGWFEATAAAGAGSRYRFRIDGGAAVGDPASRFQPDGVHGASEVIDPAGYAWSDVDWRGRPWHEAVLYELHVGAFTPAGSFTAAAERLERLRELGVTAVELMPVAQAPGRRNWGYDGAYLYAPGCAYGRPEDLKALVDRAHGLGLMVFLDVVYNHFGPEGNYLPLYAAQMFTERYETPWGPAIDFDGPHGATVRDFFVHNALYWIEEYRVDGLRLDAVHAIAEEPRRLLLEELAAAVRAAAGERHVHLVLENDANQASFLERARENAPRRYDAQWNDDVHHALHVALIGESGGYYEDYAADPVGHLGRCLAEGFAYQGEHSRHRDAPRGEPSGQLPPTAFVNFLQNHDQVGNRARGERITEAAPLEAVRAALAVILLAPSPPLMFMGEEWAARARFPFFCDFGEELAEAVREGRRREFARFPEFRDPAARERIPDPNDPATFAQAVLDWSEAERPPHAGHRAWVAALLGLRRAHVTPRLAEVAGGAGTCRRLGPAALTAGWRLGDGARYRLVANLGREPQDAGGLAPAGERLFATHEAALDARPLGELPPWSVLWMLERDGPA